MNININTPSTKPSFSGFAKFKCDLKEASELKKSVKECLPNCYIFWDKKISDKKTYYILTDKHKNKLLNYFGKMDFMDLKENIEKVFNEKAKKIKLNDLKKSLEKGKLSI